MMAEEVPDKSVGCLGALVKDTASVTRALSCGVLDRDTNETIPQRGVGNHQRLASPLLPTILR